MMLKIGRRSFDLWEFGLRNIEHRSGLVLLVARHRGDEVEVLDATVTNDMNEAAQQFADEGRLRCDEPGIRIALLTVVAGRPEATAIARKLMRSRWVHTVLTDGSERPPVVSWRDLAKMANESGMRALGWY